MHEDITPGVTTPISLTTDDGLTLEGEVLVPTGASAAAVLCHPHPLFGGNMRSLVPSELFKQLPEAGVAVLRFNFRGVEGSEGSHGDGVTEALDVESAIEALSAFAPGVPLITAAWSFGADVSLKVVDPRLAGWVAIAPPLRIVDPAIMGSSSDARPKLLIVPEHDQYDPPDRVREVTAEWLATEIEVVNGADHFLVGRTDKVAELTRAFLEERVTA